MKTTEEVEKLEKTIGQLKGSHAEISILAKKSPNDALNPFKLRLINAILNAANTVLGDDYRPFGDFTQFESDDVPSNSDVTVVLSQYMEEVERFRSDNVSQNHEYQWVYIVDGTESEIPSGRPSKVGRK